MAIYPKGYTTYAGLDLIAKSAASGEALTFTDFVYGDGDVPSDILALTKIVNQKASTPVGTLTNKGDGAFEVTTTLVNDSVENGFFIKEVGVMAKVGDMDPVLFWYTNGGNYVDYCPKAGTLFDPHPFGVTVITSNATSVTVNPVYDSIVNQVEFSAHDTSDSAHEKRFGLFQKIATLGEDLLKKLALTTTISAITALTTDSWFGQLLKMVLTASGVRYLAAQNGYICFGSFFGNLIVQWGHGYQGGIYYPVAFNLLIPRILTQHEGIDFYQTKPSDVSLTRFTLAVVGDGTAKDADWYAVGA